MFPSTQTIRHMMLFEVPLIQPKVLLTASLDWETVLPFRNKKLIPDQNLFKGAR